MLGEVLEELKKKLDVTQLSIEVLERVREKAKLGISNVSVKSLIYEGFKLKVELTTEGGDYIKHSFPCESRSVEEFMHALQTKTKNIGWYDQTQGTLNKILEETQGVKYKVFYGHDEVGFLTLIIMGKVV